MKLDQTAAEKLGYSSFSAHPIIVLNFYQNSIWENRWRNKYVIPFLWKSQVLVQFNLLKTKNRPFVCSLCSKNKTLYFFLIALLYFFIKQVFDNMKA